MPLWPLRSLMLGIGLPWNGFSQIVWLSEAKQISPKLELEGEENVGEPHLNNDVSYLWNQIDCVIDGQLLGVTRRTTRVIFQEKTSQTALWWATVVTDIVESSLPNVSGYKRNKENTSITSGKEKKCRMYVLFWFLVWVYVNLIP